MLVIFSANAHSGQWLYGDNSLSNTKMVEGLDENRQSHREGILSSAISLAVLTGQHPLKDLRSDCLGFPMPIHSIHPHARHSNRCRCEEPTGGLATVSGSRHLPCGF